MPAKTQFLFFCLRGVEAGLIPKPFDPRVVPHVARCVAEAAMETGMAQVRIDDLDAYEKAVTARIKKA